MRATGSSAQPVEPQIAPRRGELGCAGDPERAVVGELALEHAEMPHVLRAQREARRAEAQHRLARGGLERVDGAPQVRLEDLRRVAARRIVEMVVAGDLVPVRGDPRHDLRAFHRDDPGGEEGQPHPAEIGAQERLDRLVGRPQSVLAQRTVPIDAVLALEVVGDVLEVDAQPGGAHHAPARARQSRSATKPPIASRSMSERRKVAIASAGVFTIGSWMLNEVFKQHRHAGPRRRRR